MRMDRQMRNYEKMVKEMEENGFVIKKNSEIISPKTKKPLKVIIKGKLKFVNFMMNWGPYGNIGLARIMAVKFVKNPNNCKYITFKDGDSLNCKAENLEWTDINPCSEVFNYQNKKVEKFDLKTREIKIYPALSQVKKDGFDPGAVSHCCNRKRKYHKDCLWRFID
jgi:hypothetical protein